MSTHARPPTATAARTAPRQQRLARRRARDRGAKLRSKAFLISTGDPAARASLALVVSAASRPQNRAGTHGRGDRGRGSRRRRRSTGSRSPRSPTGPRPRSSCRRRRRRRDRRRPVVRPLGFTVIADSTRADELMLRSRSRRRSSCSTPTATDAGARATSSRSASASCSSCRRSRSAATIAQSVVEEKQTRVVEILHLGDPGAGAAGRQGDRQHDARVGADPRCSPRSRSSG